MNTVPDSLKPAQSSRGSYRGRPRGLFSRGGRGGRSLSQQVTRFQSYQGHKRPFDSTDFNQQQSSTSSQHGSLSQQGSNSWYDQSLQSKGNKAVRFSSQSTSQLQLPFSQQSNMAFPPSTASFHGLPQPHVQFQNPVPIATPALNPIQNSTPTSYLPAPELPTSSEPEFIN